MEIKLPQRFSTPLGQTNGFSDCEYCLEILQLIVDGEANDEHQLYFAGHIEKCLPCRDHYNLEREIKKIIQEKIEKKSVPSDLIESIRIKIREA